MLAHGSFPFLNYGEVNPQSFGGFNWPVDFMVCGEKNEFSRFIFEYKFYMGVDLCFVHWYIHPWSLEQCLLCSGHAIICQKNKYDF